MLDSAILSTYQATCLLNIGITAMDNKLAFNTAHSRTRPIVAKNPNLKYRVVFAFQLKKAIAEQPKNALKLHANGLATVAYIAKPKKAVNKKVAMVGDYKKPTIKKDNFKLSFFMLSSLLIIFALALQAINLL